MQGASQTVRNILKRHHEKLFYVSNVIFMFLYHYQNSANGNVTTSDIVYLPTPEDNGKVIACSVPVEEKNNAPTLSIKDTRILDIKRECSHMCNPKDLTLLKTCLI